MKKKLTIVYYSLLAIFLAFQIIKTVLNLSQNIGYGNNISLLEQKKQSLMINNTSLQVQLNQNLSLTNLANNESFEVEFKAISQIVSIDAGKVLASR